MSINVEPMPEQMDIHGVSNNLVSTPRKGCDPIMSTQRGKMQTQRTLLNQQLFKQIRLRSGAENLFNATNNQKVKETVALELSFVNSNMQLLKEELNEINSRVDPYQSKSGKAVSIPMLPLGLKETNELEWDSHFEDVISNHFKEEPENYRDEIADFTDLRTSVRTPARTHDGVVLLLNYSNQLKFVEKRFFHSSKPFGVHFHWYDAVTGVPAVQRSICLERASVLFNIGALYSQIGTRGDRSKRSGIEIAIDSFQRSAGVFDYIKRNFENAPTLDLSPAFLSALTYLMLAQAQECELELKLLGGFEIELGKCVSIAQASMTVAEKYGKAEKAFQDTSLLNYVPYSWMNMVQVKSHHYRALSHYYSGIGLLEQHELAEPVEIARLLATLYDNAEQSDVPKPEDAARRREDRKRLGKSHLRHAVFCHEQALQTHSLCKIARTIDVLKEYLKYAHQRSLSKFAEVDTEEDFFELVETPSIHAFSDKQSKLILPPFEDLPSKDIFRRLGPLPLFSAQSHFGSPLVATLDTQEGLDGFTLKGNSPVTVESVDDKWKLLGVTDDDVILAIDDVDVRWCNRSEVTDKVESKVEFPVSVKMVSVSKNLGSYSAVSSDNTDEMRMAENDPGKMNNNNIRSMSISSAKLPAIALKKQDENRKKRHSLGIFHGLKIRALQNRFTAIAEARTAAELHKPVVKRPASLQRSSSFTKTFLRTSAGVFQQPKTNSPNPQTADGDYVSPHPTASA